MDGAGARWIACPTHSPYNPAGNTGPPGDFREQEQHRIGVAPKDEDARLAALKSCAVMHTPREAAFDHIVFTAAQLFRVPIAMLALVDDRVVWAKSQVGPMAQERPRAETICTQVVEAGQLLVIEDTTVDARFLHLPSLHEEPPLRFFAGAPLLGPDRQTIGTLAVFDHHPRTVSERQQAQLAQLAHEAGELLRLRVPGLDISA